jgi:predicted anti-sigma-YlaC factor YlaD
VIPPRCLVIQGNLGRFVDGALASGPAAKVTEHLQACSSCLEAERIARAIPAMLASSLDPPSPPTLLPRLLTAFRRRRRLKRQAAASAAVLVAALVLLLARAALAGPGGLR